MNGAKRSIATTRCVVRAVPLLNGRAMRGGRREKVYRDD